LDGGRTTRDWIGQFEIGLIWTGLAVVVPVVFNLMVAVIDGFVDRLLGRLAQRPRPRVVDWDDPEAKRPVSVLTSFDVLPFL
jgi:hypothetical protein